MALWCALQAIFCFGIITAINTTNLPVSSNSTIAHSNGNGTLEIHRINAKPLYLSTNLHNVSDTDNWSQTRYFIRGHAHISGTTALLVILVTIGFSLTGLFLVWRRYRYVKSNAICHYTTLNQEFTLSPNEIPDPIDDQEFHLDISDTPSSDDEELLQ